MHYSFSTEGGKEHRCRQVVRTNGALGRALAQGTAFAIHHEDFPERSRLTAPTEVTEAPA